MSGTSRKCAACGHFVSADYRPEEGLLTVECPDCESEDHIARAVRVLNEALAADPVAISTLITTRVNITSTALINHETIQVGCADDGDDGCWVTPLGLINGLFGIDERQWGHIAIEVPEPDSRVVTRFIDLREERAAPPTD